MRRHWVTEAGEVFLTSDGHGGLSRIQRRDNLAAILRLIDLGHNCARQPGADCLHCVANDLFGQRSQRYATP